MKMLDRVLAPIVQECLPPNVKALPEAVTMLTGIMQASMMHQGWSTDEIERAVRRRQRPAIASRAAQLKKKIDAALDAGLIVGRSVEFAQETGATLGLGVKDIELQLHMLAMTGLAMQCARLGGEGWPDEPVVLVPVCIASSLQQRSHGSFPEGDELPPHRLN